jgi:hypothetical protein
MDRGAFISRRESERTTLRDALIRYQREVTPFKRDTTADSENRKINRWLRDQLSTRILANIRGQDVAEWRDARIKEGYAANTVRLWLSTLSHVFTIARKEWGMEALANPVQVVRMPSLQGTERDRRLNDGEEQLLLATAAVQGGEIGSIITLAIETGTRSPSSIRM